MEGIIAKEIVKEQMKKNYIKYLWDMYKLTIEDIFDNKGDNFFEFIESINIREELPKIATEDYLRIVKEYSQFKKDNGIE